MKKFMFLYNAGGEQTPEMKQKWMEWFNSITDHTVDGGNPLINGHNVTDAGAEKLGEENTLTTGYSLVNAESLEEALSFAEGCPNGVHVYEALSM